MKKIPSGKISPKPPKFNFMWLMVAMFLGFFALQYFVGENAVKEISYSEFESKMLKPGDVQKLVAYKKNDLVEVEVYIKPDRLKEAKYKEYQGKNSFGPSTGPLVYFTASSMEAAAALLK